MCGIAGIYSYGKTACQVDQEELLHIRDAMVSRGPDGSGLWLAANKRVGLAHRRLSIIDLSKSGNQPMTTKERHFHIVFNGEIYNYREVRDHLKSKGYLFRTNSDTEVLLHLYAEYTIDMVHHLRGMYAFAIWDEKKQGLFLARDPFGIKPLYYADNGSTFRIASQVKALVAGGGIDIQAEPAGHVGFFLWGSVPEPFTLYRDIFSLPAGHSLWVDENGLRVPHCFFDVAEEFTKASTQPCTTAMSTEAFRAALSDSMKHHLVSDVPVGVFLSSGVDSGTITALASELTPNINAVTLGFKEYEGTEQDEVPLARKLSERYSCRHHISQITRHDFDRDLHKIIGAMDQPSIDGVNTYFVARAAAQAGLKVVLSGLGGDELLGGYPGFRQIPRLLSYTRIPSLLPGFGRAFRLVTAPLMKRMTSPKYAGLFEYGGSYGEAYLLRRSLFMPWELPEILDPDFAREGWETLQPMLHMDDLTGNLPRPKVKLSLLELTQYMRNTLLRDSDWAGMAHSLEIRVPLVDITFFRELLPYISSSVNVPTKQDMSQTPAIPLPDEVVNRPKTGFSVPVQQWVESAGLSKQTRGLRGWALRVYAAFGANELKRHVRRKRIFTLVTDAFGSNGGIAKFNRDFLTAVSVSPLVSNVVVVTRNHPNCREGLPPKLYYDTSGISGKWSYVSKAFSTSQKFGRFDLILCGHINLLPVAYLVSRIKRAPLWCVIHGVDAWKPHHSRIANWIISKVDGFVSVSEFTKRRFTGWSEFPEDRVSLLPNCYESSSFGPGQKSEDLLKRYGLQGKTVLMTLGRLSSAEQYKGIDEIIANLSALAEQIPNITYLIVGQGDDKKRLQEKAEAFGVADRVIFTGYVRENEKADYYRLGDAYVMPGRGEGFGIVYLEAMACGVPVVASKADGSREAVLDGKLGIIVDPNNPEEIKEGVLYALQHPRGVVPNGLEYFSLHAYRQRTFRLLDRVFSGDPDAEINTQGLTRNEKI